MAFSGPLEDRVGIRELMDTYADAISRIDEVDYAACWAEEDAVWRIPFYPAIGTVEGKPKILEIWREAMKTFAGDIFIMTPGSIKVNGDSAETTAYTSEVYVIGETIFRDRGFYQDICVKVDGRWLFKERTFHLKHRETSTVKPEDTEFTA